MCPKNYQKTLCFFSVLLCPAGAFACAEALRRGASPPWPCFCILQFYFTTTPAAIKESRGLIKNFRAGEMTRRPGKITVQNDLQPGPIYGPGPD